MDLAKAHLHGDVVQCGFPSPWPFQKVVHEQLVLAAPRVAGVLAGLARLLGRDCGGRAVGRPELELALRVQPGLPPATSPAVLGPGHRAH